MKALVCRPRGISRGTRNWEDMFEDFFGYWNRNSLLDRVFQGAAAEERTVPAVDVREEDARYLLEAELPGLTEKDITIKVDENLLTIEAGKEEQKETKKEGFIRQERQSRTFSRSFVLPQNVDAGQIQANFKNGLLTLEVPKVPEAEPQVSKINQG